MDFTGFLGNDAIKRRLSGAFASGRVAHSYLLCGPAGSGKHTLARILCAAMECEKDGAAVPCGVCPGCRKALAGIHPDVITVDDPDHKAMTVDPIRAARSDMFIRPNEGRRKIYVIPRGQDMNESAQNALLKILEEPPAHVIFILTCENRSQLLETVRSRCVCLTLQPVAWDEAAPVLHSRLPQEPPQELQRAHSLFGGCIGQVISGITDGTLQQVLELTPAIGEAIVDPQELTLLRLTARLEKERALTDGVLAGLILLLRDALAARSGSPTRLSTAPETALLLAGRLNGARLMALLETVESLQQDVLHSMNNTLFLTRMSACLRQAAGY